MFFYGSLCVLMRSYGFLSVFISLYAYVCVHMGTYRSLYILMGFFLVLTGPYASLWTLMDLYGYL